MYLIITKNFNSYLQLKLNEIIRKIYLNSQTKLHRNESENFDAHCQQLIWYQMNLFSLYFNESQFISKNTKLLLLAGIHAPYPVVRTKRCVDPWLLG